ncbi:type II toxin-antitoxin system RelE family toxin [Candidatus Leptofilum sp.]|uniref:type II toxin-antitoxin system RelE family toxin n=1 Tax=Candidatus Leptofilum sp. TaxID=3241576 RepID=UPI003B5C952A
MYSIEWTRKALKQLKRIQQQHQKRIVVSVRELENWPDCQNVKALTNRPGYRLRVGSYRVLFEVEDGMKIIEIEEVKKRDDRTY